MQSHLCRYTSMWMYVCVCVSVFNTLGIYKLINEFHKISGYKVSIKTSVVLPHTENKLTDN